MITKKQLLNEIMGTGNIGKVYGKLVMTPQDWDKSQLKPFGIPVSQHKDPEIAYDDMDGDLSVSQDESDAMDDKMEMLSKIISQKKKEYDIQNDDSGGNITEQLWPNNFILEKNLNEDLRVWFGKKKKPKGSSQPKGPWVNICRKDENGKHPPCGRENATSKSYPKCRAAGVAAKMSDAEKKAACAKKRKAEKSHDKSGTGNKPKMVSSEAFKHDLRKFINESLNLYKVRNYLYDYYDLNNLIEPATAPIKKGYVRVYHQTSLENFEKIKNDGEISISKSTGYLNREPIIIWGQIIKDINDRGFYGEPKKRFTIEYQVPEDEIDKGNGGVGRNVISEDILAYHDPRLFNIKDIVDNDDYLNNIINNLEFWDRFKDAEETSVEYAYYLIAKAIKKM